MSGASDLTAVRRRILEILHESGDMVQNELARKAKIRDSWASQILGKMEKEGLLSREPCETSRKKRMVKITKKGEDVFQLVKDAPSLEEETSKRARIQDLMECLSDTEQKTFTKLLQKIYDKTNIHIGNTDSWTFDIFSSYHDYTSRNLSSEEKELRKEITDLRNKAGLAGYPIAIIYYSRQHGFYERCAVPLHTNGEDPEVDELNERFYSFLREFLGDEFREPLSGHAIVEITKIK